MSPALRGGEEDGGGPMSENKRDLASVAFPACCPGMSGAPRSSASATYTMSPDKLARDCRRFIASDWYQPIFPTRLSAQREAVPEFDTTVQGGRLATPGRRRADPRSLNRRH